MLAAVVPYQMPFAHAEGKAIVQHAFQIFVFQIILVHVGGIKEFRRRQLLRIAHYHRRFRAGDRAHRLCRGHLRGFVENHQIKRVCFGRQILRHRGGTHQKARAYPLHQFRHFRKQTAHAAAAQLRFRKPRKRRYFHAQRPVIAVFVFRQTGDEVCADFFPRERREVFPRHAEFFHRFFQRAHRTARQIGVGGDIDGKKVLIHVLFKARQYVRARQLAAFQRLADKAATQFFQLRHRLFVHTPVGKHIEVIDKRAGFRIEIVGHVLARNLVFVRVHRRKKTLFRRFERIRRL